MAERLYKITDKGRNLLKQLKCNERVDMVKLAASSLLINHENKSSQNSLNSEKASK